MSNAARAYLREVKSLIPCPGSMKAAFLRQLEDEVFLYCEDRGEIDTNQLNARFGAPGEVAKEFLEALDPVALRRSVQTRQRVILIAAVLVVLIIAIAAASKIQSDTQQKAFSEDNYIEFVPYEGELPEASGPAYWVRTNDGKDVQYWEYDYELNDWVNVTLPSE